MNAGLDASLLSIRKLFSESGVHYEIPIYQRNFSWGHEQIEQLIDDVWTAAQEGSSGEYFLGNLIVARKTQAAHVDTEVYEVIDGQQRLTTLLMLLSRLKFESAAKVTYASRRSATDDLANLAQTGDDKESGILTGYRIIDARISRFDADSDERGRFTSFLLDQVTLVRAVLPAGTDFNRYFEIMNTRGQQLEQVDIVKARLMGYLRPDSTNKDVEGKRACFAWVWDSCVEMDLYIQMSLTPGNTKLRAEVFGEGWNSLARASFTDLIGSIPKIDAATQTRSGAVSLTEALKEYAKPQSPLSVTVNDDALRFGSPIRFTNLLLHTLSVMRADDSIEVDRYLDDSKIIERFDGEFRNLSEEERSTKAEQFAESLLRCKFVLDNFILKREFTATNGEDGAWSLKRLVKKHETSRKEYAAFPPAFSRSEDEVDGETSDQTREILLLQSLLRVTYTSPRTMHWITRILRLDLIGVSPEAAGKAIEKELRSYVRGKVSHALPRDGGPTGFGIERIVYTYLDFLLAQGAAPGSAKDPKFTFVFRNSVEHFFPQHANPDDAGSDEVPPGDDALHMFGNLALVSVSANSKFSNLLPKHKAGKKEMIQQSKKLGLMAHIAESDEGWCRQSILDHGNMMLELLESDLEGSGYQV